MSDLSDFSMMELFRAEVETQAAAINDALVQLEQNPRDPAVLESLMRAAHSIKGAARIVDLSPAVTVAHAMEDAFVRAGEGQLALKPGHIDLLLAGIDQIVQLASVPDDDRATWIHQHQASIDELACRLSNLQDQPAADASLKPSAPPAAATERPSAIAEPAPAPEPAPDSSARTATPEQVVRIAADSLTQLLSLAGESLVQARAAAPMGQQLLLLKKQNMQLRDQLDQLRLSARSQAGPWRSWQQQVQAACDTAGAAYQQLLEAIDRFDTLTRQSTDVADRLYRQVLASRMRPIGQGVQAFRRMVRDMARSLGKQVDFAIVGDDTPVDRDILDRLESPLNHLLRNALDHGLETPQQRQAAGKPPTGTLRIEACHQAGMLMITVWDDGRGIDVNQVLTRAVDRGIVTPDLASRLTQQEIYDFLFLPNFTTAGQVTEISGRGVGLDAVHTLVQQIGGKIRVTSKRSEGTRFVLELPITLSVIRAVLARVAGQLYAFPLTRIDRIMRLPRHQISYLENRQFIRVEDDNVGLVAASQVLELPQTPSEPDQPVCAILISDAHSRFAVAVDGFAGEQDLVVRPLDSRLGKVQDIAAAATTDDGQPVLIVDVEDLVRSIDALLRDQPLEHVDQSRQQARALRPAKRILVVDDSITVREVQRHLLAGRGYDVDTAVDGVNGLNMARKQAYDLIVSDIDMPRMNGLEMIRKLKQEPRTQSICTIIVSYKDRDADRLAGLEAGADHYLTKSSFHDNTLIQTVVDLIGEPR